MTMTPLAPKERYCLVPEGGLRRANEDDRTSLSGEQWGQLQGAMDDTSAYTSTLRTCLSVVSDLRPQLRTLLNYHCGVGTLKTRQMMIDIQNL